MRFNLPIRFKNPAFIALLFLAVAAPIGLYTGTSAEDVTSWQILGELILEAVKNPYVLSTVVVSVYGVLVNPTTPGAGDPKEEAEGQ